jgi:hypothetical protein
MAIDATAGFVRIAASHRMSPRSVETSNRFCGGAIAQTPLKTLPDSRY